MDDLMFYLHSPFFWRALAVGILVALSSSLLGVNLILRRLSFMGDGLSHVAFGAMAVAGLLNLAGASIYLALPVTAVCAVFLLKGSKGEGATGGDAALAMLSVGAMAIGYLTMNLFPSSANVSGDVCTSLFGASSLITLTSGETWLSGGLCVFVLLFQIFTYHRSFDIAFDEQFALACRSPARLLNFFSAIVTAIVIVVSMRLVGALLVSSLLVFPGVSAMRLARSFKGVCVIAALSGVVCAFLGITIALFASTSVGATIVLVNIAFYLLCRLR